jgi:DNA-binding protein YbaB
MTDDDSTPDLPDLSGLLGGGEGAMPDLGSLFEGLGKAQAIQAQVFEGSAGGGLVRVRATGGMAVESVVIQPQALDGAEPDEVADLVHAALNDLTARIAEAQREAMGPLGGILGT